jgi:hypothetical protein
VGTDDCWGDSGELDLRDSEGLDEASLAWCDACSKTCGGNDILLVASVAGEVVAASLGEMDSACGVDMDTER